MHLKNIITPTKSDLYKTLMLIAGLALAWLAGLAIFIHNIQEQAPIEQPKVDAIVILTGGTKRLDEGLGLFEKVGAKKILISGVGKGFSNQSLTPLLKKHQHVNIDDIFLGELADSTASNAIEAKVFMELNGFHSMLLVTSNYHLLRSSIAFKKEMPDYELYFYPVCSDNFVKKNGIISWPSLKLAVVEYNKLLLFCSSNFYSALISCSDDLAYKLVSLFHLDN